MSTNDGNQSRKGEILLKMRGLRIEGQSEERWHEIVHGVDVTLRRGEVLGLIGESGAGKSTIGIASMAYAKPGCRITAGTIEFDGQDLLSLSEDEKRKLRGPRIAYVAQSAAACFNPAHKLIDQYGEAAVQHGVLSKEEANRDAVDLYRRLQLPNPEIIGDRYPHQVSGGQLQRAMVAMAMACKPDLIVFDEPTTALDVTTQIEVLAAIKDVVHQFEHSGDLYYPRSGGGLAGFGPHHGAALRQRGGGRRSPPNGRGSEAGLHPAAAVGAQQHQDRGRCRKRVRSRFWRSATSPRPMVEQPWCCRMSASISTGRRPWRSSVESGSGKSTLARVITGLLPPIKGEIIYDGESWPLNYKRRNRQQLRRLQMIYQLPDIALNPRQKIKDVIGRPLQFYLGLQGADRDARIAELLDMIELPAAFAERLPNELSGGQKQRICIARALAAEPEMIICDEVTSALDQLVAEEILKLLQRLQDDLGITYLFITHDLATVRAISDEIVVMLQGRVVEHGAKSEVLNPPHHEYTDLLLSSVPEMDPDWLDGLLEERRQRLARGEKVLTAADN